MLTSAVVVKESEVIMNMSDDVMERGQAVAVACSILQELNERTVDILENMSDAFFALDNEWRLVYMNQMAECVFGGNRANFLGKDIWQVFPRSVDDVFYQQYQRAMAEGVAIEFEAFGSVVQRWLEVRAYPSKEGLFVFFRDVTGQRMTGTQRYYMEALIEASNDAIMAMTLGGYVICWNKGAERLYEYTAEEMLGEPISIIMPADREQETVDIIERTCRGEQDERYETVRVRKDGTLIDISLTASPIKDEQDGILGIAVIAHDITERKRIERELHEKEQRKDDFISIASHELKTPLTSIKAMTQLLQRRFDRDGNREVVSYLARIDGQINRLTRLVSDLLDVTKIQTGRLGLVRASFDFDEWLKELIGDLQQGSSHRIISSGKVGRAIVGDRDLLGQVVTNLITNGIKYSPRAETIDVRVMTNQDSVVISVQDYGIGIPSDMQEKVFERFFRVADNRNVLGLGLGLYISAEIVKLHGGKIWVESVEGKGSIFSFSLPSSVA